jgi:hypothetical protein
MLTRFESVCVDHVKVTGEVLYVNMRPDVETYLSARPVSKRATDLYRPYRLSFCPCSTPPAEEFAWNAFR